MPDSKVQFEVSEPSDNERAWYPNWMSWEYVSGVPGLRVAYGHFDTKSKRGYVDYLEVEPGKRRQGIGRIANSEIEKFLGQQGMSIVTGHAMEGSEPFHKAMGYEITTSRGHLPRVTKRLAGTKSSRLLKADEVSKEFRELR